MTTDNYHAVVSPSGSYKWLTCAGSIAMESTIDNQSSEFADEGTCAHEIGALCLTNKIGADTYINQRITVGERNFTVDAEMAAFVQIYVDQINEYVKEYKLRGAVSVDLLVEVEVPIGHITGEEGARGTSDVIIIAVWADGTATVHSADLKYGRGVAVEATDNPQLKMYALGAVEKYGLLYDFTSVRLSIHQPRIQHAASEWECTIEHLEAFGKHASERARHALSVLQNEKPGAYVHHLTAGEHCKKAFCRARGHCPKLDAFVADAVGADFEDLSAATVQAVQDLATTREAYAVQCKWPFEEANEILNFGAAPAELLGPTLSDKMAVLDIVDDWIKAVRGRVEYELLHGRAVPGYKLVKGKQGNRAWSDEQEATALLKSFRLKVEDMFDLRLISPTTAEKVLKESPKRWTKAQALISRSDGKPSVAPESDKRPALVIAPPSDDFDALDDGSDLV